MGQNVERRGSAGDIVVRHVVVGTAGHVDHGKTALVKALTGIDADRWAEEKRRGITIDLGFAKLDLGEDFTASVVDVPGHEDFVRNMVAGATGMDVVLLVVAADEGVMPQTHEHLAILEFLSVRTGVVAITKCDLVDEEWLELVEDDVRSKLSTSSIAWSANILRVSAETGQGINDLRAGLADAAKAANVRTEIDLFRLPIDRAFSIAGAGTVVTGTTWTGTVNVGDEVRILPGKGGARVRGIEVHDETCRSALPGRRTALALTGLSRTDVERGHTVVADKVWRSTNAVDVLVTLLPESRPLTQRSRVRFHIGTEEVMARLTPADPEVSPGAENAPVRMRLEAPVVCRWGDRGVLRSYSPVTTIGGCVVADPFPPAKPRRPQNLLERAVTDPEKRLAAFVDAAEERGLDADDLTVRLGIPPALATSLLKDLSEIVRAGDRLFSPTAATAARTATLSALEEYHKDSPLEFGMPRDLARQQVSNEALADVVHTALASEGVLVIDGKVIRLSTFSAALSPEQTEIAEHLKQELAAAGFEGRAVAELGEVAAEEVARELLGFLVREGTTVRVGKDRYYDRGELAKLISVVMQEIERLGQVTPADLRERTGLSRKYLIPLLEWMDGQSLTVRLGDARGRGSAVADA
jgi:selenocysteine-specific elongation factor